MKSVISILFVLILITADISGQSADSSAVDIRAILEKQIAGIKSKENEIAKTEILNKKQQAGIVPVNDKSADSFEEYLTKDNAVKLFVVIEIIMILGLIYLWSTKSQREKRRKIAILKNNIKQLREERIGSFQSKSLSMLRGKLRFDPIKINDKGKDITYRARKNKIGKGEIHLAAKIKLLSGEYK